MAGREGLEGAARANRRLHEELVAMAWRDRALYALAAAAQLAGLAMRPVTGTAPDWELVLTLGARLLVGAAGLGVVLIAYRFCWLAVARSTTPTRDLLRWVTGFVRRQGLVTNVFHTLALFFLFATGFAVLKGAIAVIAPFSSDSALADADRALHFGRQPYEWLEPLLRCPPVVFAVNICYNLWFFMVVAAFAAAACATRNQRLRHQYLMSFMLVWLVGGFLVAMAFASAGPAYYARIGLGDLFAPLMAQLHAADARLPVWALATQDLLWAGYGGTRPGSAGISAFPSMHVATATLFVLAARRIHARLFLLSLAYWVVIMVGSVLLAWHYACDGYAAALTALVFWRLAGLYGRKVFGEPKLELEA